MNCGTGDLNPPIELNKKEFLSQFGKNIEDYQVIDNEFNYAYRLPSNMRLSQYDHNKELSTGVYKLTFIINSHNIESIKNISKSVLVGNETKDIYFYKIDIFPINEKQSQVTVFFEVVNNSFLLSFVIVALSTMGIGITTSIAMTKLEKATYTAGSLFNDMLKVAGVVIGIIVLLKLITKIKV